MRLLYSRTELAPEGWERRNPRFFEGAEPGVEEVVIDAAGVDNTATITGAYMVAGVPVRIENLPITVLLPEGAPMPAAPSLKPVEIPADWRALPFIGKADQLTLRQLAALVSCEPIKTKADAVRAIEIELERRAADGS